jgi:hypothetical protein
VQQQPAEARQQGGSDEAVRGQDSCQHQRPSGGSATAQQNPPPESLPHDAGNSVANGVHAAATDQQQQGGGVGRRGGASEPPSAATLRRLERIAAARRARGLDPSPSAHTAEGREAVCPGFPPASFGYVLCDAPCTALGLRPR